MDILPHQPFTLLASGPLEGSPDASGRRLEDSRGTGCLAASSLPEFGQVTSFLKLQLPPLEKGHCHLPGGGLRQCPH